MTTAADDEQKSGEAKNAPRRSSPTGAQIEPWFSLALNRFRTVKNRKPKGSDAEATTATDQSLDQEEEDANRVFAEYQNRAIDRQLNKARGLLAYNSILVAAISQALWHLNDHWYWRGLALIAVPLALASCGFLLSMMFMQWDEPSAYERHTTVAKSLFRTECTRTHQINRAAFLSSVALPFAAVVIVSALLFGESVPSHSSAKPSAAKDAMGIRSIDAGSPARQ